MYVTVPLQKTHRKWNTNHVHSIAGGWFQGNWKKTLWVLCGNKKYKNQFLVSSAGHLQKTKVLTALTLSDGMNVLTPLSVRRPDDAAGSFGHSSREEVASDGNQRGEPQRREEGRGLPLSVPRFGDKEREKGHSGL